MCDRAEFFGKNPHWPKMTKNCQKCPKNMVLGLFKKIMSLVLSDICEKWMLLWFINILWKLHAWEKSSFQVIAQNGSLPVRFQYFLIVNNISIILFSLRLITNFISLRVIPDFDFWHVDRHEWKKQDTLTGFLEKFSLGEVGHFGPKNSASS